MAAVIAPPQVAATSVAMETSTTILVVALVVVALISVIVPTVAPAVLVATVVAVIAGAALMLEVQLVIL